MTTTSWLAGMVSRPQEPVDEVVCSTEGCGHSFGAYPAGMGPSRPACPQCGAMARTVRKSPFPATLDPRASLSYGAYPKGATSKRRRFAWGFTGWDFSVRLQRLVRKDSLFDKRSDRRYEHVEDTETGEVLKHQDHALTEYTGHGSAKFKKPE